MLALNYASNQLSIKRFNPSDIDAANEYYKKLENEYNGSKTDAVLVRVSSFSELQIAYPNYFNDISDFVALIEDFLNH